MSVITYKVGEDGNEIKIRDYMKESLNFQVDLFVGLL